MSYKDRAKQKKYNAAQYQKLKDGPYCCACRVVEKFTGSLFCAPCREKRLSEGKARDKVARAKVLSHYGSRCACCGESIEQFLTIDHPNNDGNLHTSKAGYRLSAGKLCDWLIKHDFPADFQILCWNCNCGKRMNNGVCPHQDQPRS